MKQTLPNLLLKFKERLPARPEIMAVLRKGRWMAEGLARDFWKDSDATISAGAAGPMSYENAVAAAAAMPVKASPDGLWRPEPGEISERMWGKDFILPGDAEMTERMIRPLGLDKDMSVLDLSAGLGGHMRKPIEEFAVHISGMEVDADIAQRGMKQLQASGRGKRATIAAYDPLNLTADRLYDCILARETLHHMPDKEKFIKSMLAISKPKVQFSFTDYVVNPEMRDAPAIAAWRAFEKGADPVGLVEMAELWAKSGVNLRVHDDQTDTYKKEVMLGLARFAKFMASGVKPAPETKKAIDKHITLWAHRVSALNAGMKFYRFYGLRG